MYITVNRILVILQILLCISTQTDILVKTQRPVQQRKKEKT